MMDKIFQKIKNNGFRLTKIRVAMIKIMFNEKRPLTSFDIQRQLSLRQIKASRTTIYRELLFLLKQAVVKKIRFTDYKIHYEICSGHHHHLICAKCNDIKEIVLGEHLEQQEKKIYKKERFKVISHSLEFYGLCRNCLS